MNHRPYPDRDRALAQLERRRPPEPPLITSFAQLQTHITSGEFHRRIYAAIANFNAALARRAGASVAANATVFTSAVQARADAEAARLRAEASGPPKCAGCGHAQHAPGSECEAGVDHGTKRWHRCLCLATPGASKACPPQMDCQGGTLSYSDVWHLRQGRSVRGPAGETITPDVLAERQAAEEHVVAHRAPGSGWLYCTRCLDGCAFYAPLTSSDLPDGGICDVCGRDVLLPRPGTTDHTLTQRGERQPLVLARVVQTCQAVPSQWNAWTTSGQYLYLRYRSGIGTVDAYDTEDNEQWTRVPDGAVARFDTGDRLDGEMDLTEFCERTGLQLAADAEVTGQ